jgi:class 3 adenylate cyclase
MISAVKTFDTALRDILKGHKLVARIGIHCGHVLAGVIGEDMPRYQLFGPTVDEVQAMESSSEPGCVHASSAILPHLRAAIRVDDKSGTRLVVSDIQVVKALDDGSAYVGRNRTAGALGGVKW